MGAISKIVTRSNEKSTSPVMMISTPSGGFIYQSERYAFDNAGQSLKKYTLLNRGELSYNHGASKLRPYGSCFVMKEHQARVPFVYHSFNVVDNSADFVSTYLNLDQVQNSLRKLISSGARMDGLLNISYDEYMSLDIKLPSKTEQELIAQYLGNIDDLITLHQRKFSTDKE